MMRAIKKMLFGTNLILLGFMCFWFDGSEVGLIFCLAGLAMTINGYITTESNENQSRSDTQNDSNASDSISADEMPAASCDDSIEK